MRILMDHSGYALDKTWVIGRCSTSQLSVPRNLSMLHHQRLRALSKAHSKLSSRGQCIAGGWTTMAIGSGNLLGRFSWKLRQADRTLAVTRPYLALRLVRLRNRFT